MSRHQPWCASHRDFAEIGNFFAEGIEFLAEGGGQEWCIKMGFGGNGAVVSPWLVPFFLVFLLFNFLSVGEKGGETYPLDPLLLLAKHPVKEISTSPTFTTLKVRLKVLHKCGYSPLHSRSVIGGPLFCKIGVLPWIHIRQDPNSFYLNYQQFAGIVVRHRGSIRGNLGLFRPLFSTKLAILAIFIFSRLALC